MSAEVVEDAKDQEHVTLIKRQYLQQIPMRSFIWPQPLSESCQSLIWTEILAPGLHKYPPLDRYQYLFLRDLVTALGYQELNEDILMSYTAYIRDPPAVIPATKETIITYIAPGLGDIYLAEQPSLLVSDGTTGLRTWEASFALAEWLLEQDLEGKKVLEFGTGTGFVSILAAKKGAKVLATDGSKMVVNRLRDNFERNSVVAETKVLWWGKKDEDLEKEWDYVLGADVTYDVEVCASLAASFECAIRSGGVGVLAATVRNEETLAAFIKECELRNLIVVDTPGRDNGKRVFFRVSELPTRLLRITRKAVKERVNGIAHPAPVNIWEEFKAGHYLC